MRNHFLLFISFLLNHFICFRRASKTFQLIAEQKLHNLIAYEFNYEGQQLLVGLRHFASEEKAPRVLHCDAKMSANHSFFSVICNLSVRPNVVLLCL